jgi:hypothetical protein
MAPNSVVGLGVGGFAALASLMLWHSLAEATSPVVTFPTYIGPSIIFAAGAYFVGWNGRLAPRGGPITAAVILLFGSVISWLMQAVPVWKWVVVSLLNLLGFPFDSESTFIGIVFQFGIGGLFIIIPTFLVAWKFPIGAPRALAMLFLFGVCGAIFASLLFSLVLIIEAKTLPLLESMAIAMASWQGLLLLGLGFAIDIGNPPDASPRMNLRATIATLIVAIVAMVGFVIYFPSEQVTTPRIWSRPLGPLERAELEKNRKAEDMRLMMEKSDEDICDGLRYGHPDYVDEANRRQLTREICQ